MNSIIKNIDRLELNENIIDFQPIYDLGRTLPFTTEENIEYFPIDSPDINNEFTQQVKNVITSLCQLLKNGKNKFHPAFIELSLFDPKDRTGKIFYSVLMSNIEATVGCYRREMKENRWDNPGRGPIIPHKKLHTSAFYCYREKRTSEGSSILKFNELNDLPHYIYIGRFYTLKVKEENNKEELKKYIFNFFDKVGNNCFKTLDDENGKHIFNASFLIPLFRPAALLKGEEKENIYNGGGIFVYGNLPKHSNENKFVLKLQTNLTKSIFKASHAQIEYDEADTYNSYFTAMVLHQLRTKLHNNVVKKLVGLRTNNQPETPIEESVNFTIIYVENVISKLSIFLDNFQPRHKDSEINPIRFGDFKKLVDEIATEMGVASEINTNNSEDVSELLFRKENFELIVDEIFENAMKYYRTYEVPNNKRKIVVHWNILEEQKVLQIRFISENTMMPSTDITSFGKEIITGKESSGLGGFLVNYALEQNDALRFPEGRYINPKQTDAGLLVEIAFKIK